MNIKELQERYRGMETDELISVAFSNKEEYTQEATQAAATELRDRGVSLEAESTIVIAKEIKQKREKEEIELKTKPLTKTQKIWFTALPGLSYWYVVFAKISPKERSQRIKDANKCMYWGFALWLTIALIIWLLMKFIKG